MAPFFYVQLEVSDMIKILLKISIGLLFLEKQDKSKL